MFAAAQNLVGVAACFFSNLKQLARVRHGAGRDEGGKTPQAAYRGRGVFPLLHVIGFGVRVRRRIGVLVCDVVVCW